MSVFSTPDYSGHGLVNLISSIRFACGDDTAPQAHLHGLNLESVAGARHVVLLVIDGLGFEYLQKQSGSFLQKHCSMRLTSVFPTTTSAAISTIMSGHAPRQHGLTGWFMYLQELAAVTAILPFVSRVGNISFQRHGVDIRYVVDVSGFYAKLQRQVYVVSEQRLINSPFSHCFTSEVNNLGYDDLNGCMKQLRKVTSQSERTFTYAYWAQLDHDGHVYGMDSPQTSRHFAELDQALEKLATDLVGTDTCVLITADHGLIDTATDRVIHLEDHPDLQAMLSHPLCGEPRAAYCYVKAGQAEAFENYVRSQLGEVCELWRSDDLVQQGVFGEGESHPQLRNRIGDYTLLMKSNYVIKDRLLGEKPFNQRGVHGGLSTEELFVPLITLNL